MAIINDLTVTPYNGGGNWMTMFAGFDGVFTSLNFTNHSGDPQWVASRLFKPGMGNLLFLAPFIMGPYETVKIRIPAMHLQSANGEGFEFYTTGPVTATCTGIWIAGAPPTNSLYCAQPTPGNWQQILDGSGWKVRSAVFVNRGSDDCVLSVRIRNAGNQDTRNYSTNNLIPEGKTGRIVFNGFRVPPGWVLDVFCNRPINTFFSAVIA